MDWLVTIPKTVDFRKYIREINTAAEQSLVSNYRVRSFPLEMKKGDRCFVVHKGLVRGWMEIVGWIESDGFRCESTGRWWPSDKYIQRAGKFHPHMGPEIKGFRGVRKFNGAPCHQLPLDLQ